MTWRKEIHVIVVKGEMNIVRPALWQKLFRMFKYILKSITIVCRSSWIRRPLSSHRQGRKMRWSWLSKFNRLIRQGTNVFKSQSALSSCYQKCEKMFCYCWIVVRIENSLDSRFQTSCVCVCSDWQKEKCSLDLHKEASWKFFLSEMIRREWT